MPGGIGPLELGIVLLIVLVVFGPKRLPSIGRQLGTGMRQFKHSITGKSREDQDEERREVLAASEPQPSVERRDDAVSQPRA